MAPSMGRRHGAVRLLHQVLGDGPVAVCHGLDAGRDRYIKAAVSKKKNFDDIFVDPEKLEF